MIYPLQQLLHLYQIHILRIIVYSDILPVHTLPLYPINTFPVPCRSTIQYLMYQQMRFLRCMYFLPCTSPIYALKTDFPACLRLSPYILSVLLNRHVAIYSLLLRVRTKVISARSCRIIIVPHICGICRICRICRIRFIIQ